jgi:hypothetical protein
VTRITLQGGEIVLRDGKVGTEQACCCGGGVCCLPDGTCSTEYTTKQQCEQCVQAYQCFDYETFESLPVEDCSECEGECSEVTEGACGTWLPGVDGCDPNPCPVPCAGIDAGNGWFTETAKADFENFIRTAGYTRPVFTPQQPFAGIEVPLPYVSGCGQTFYRVTYECCGFFGIGNPCDPSFFSQVIREAGGGVQDPPCNLSDPEGFLWACCEEEPPP